MIAFKKIIVRMSTANYTEYVAVSTYKDMLPLVLIAVHSQNKQMAIL